MNKMLIASILLAITTVNYAQASTEETHNNIAGIFIGTTTMESETNFSYAFEYEYKLSKQWGAGIVYEKTDDANSGEGVDIALASAYLHPWKELRLGLGFGQEKLGGNNETASLVRTSFSYDFHVASFAIEPTLAFDFINDETATVVGIAFAKTF